MNKLNSDSYYKYFVESYLKKDTSLFKFGSIGDGGYYLNPKTLTESDLLFSGGISSNLEFEFDFYRFNANAPILMIDPTVSKWKLLIKGFTRLFFKKPDKLRYLYNTLIFWDLKTKKRCRHLPLWLNKSKKIFELINSNFGLKKDVILKLDIEGSEYDFLDEILKNKNAISALVFEFHDLHKKFIDLDDFFKELTKDFDLVFIDINPSGGFENSQPKCIEVSFERK